MQPWMSMDRAAGYRTMEVRPQNGAVGAELRGVDLRRPIPPEQSEEIRRALAENLVIFTREQQGMTREQHIAFAETFGPLQKIPHIFSVEGYPDVQIVERKPDDQRRVVGEGFHNDSTFMDTPPTTVTMHAIEVPDYGGDTAFANMYLAYETLSPTFRDWLETLKAVNSASALFGTGADQSRVMMKKMDTDEGDREVIHPLVATHPVSGRKFLFFNRVYTRRIEGLTDSETANLFDFLAQHSSQMAFTGRVSYRPGTVLVWDNWAAHHSAIADYQGKHRYLERVTTGGIRPH